MYCDNAPACYTATTPRARVQHTCCECRRAIPVGDRYDRFTGVWDGTPGSYATCRACAAAKAWLASQPDQCDCTAFGGLVEALHEYAGPSARRGAGTSAAVAGRRCGARWTGDAAAIGHAAGLLVRHRVAWDCAAEERMATCRRDHAKAVSL